MDTKQELEEVMRDLFIPEKSETWNRGLEMYARGMDADLVAWLDRGAPKPKTKQKSDGWDHTCRERTLSEDEAWWQL